ncbi:hypothetical protein [uncultured Flavobacterium sp.]|uniref:hypothetical protein n=1 Tax=uncultured Flavobacterium sp. TaxID=165435 RepID=UPI0030C80D9E
MPKCFFFFLICLTTSYSQHSGNVTSAEQGKIVLFGESHFVKEKYDEMKVFIMDRLKDVPAGEKVTFFLELPSSFNYALEKMKVDKDTMVFRNWFNNVYAQKDKAPSYFWTDYRDFIVSLLEFAKEKEIDLNFKAIDVETEFRRTAYILSSFETKFGTKIDSLLNLNTIHKNEVNRSFLVNYVHQLAQTTTTKNEQEILERVKEGLLIDCTICRKRDEFMYNNFIKNYDPTDYIVFGTLGLDHVVNKPDFSATSDFFKFNHKVDTINHKSFYQFLKTDFKDKIYRVGIIALKQGTTGHINLKKTMDYSATMTKEEREHIEALLINKEVIRIYPYEDEVLKNISLNLNYLIVYKSSNFRN